MFSFGVKREPENHQRFRRAGSTRKGLLAPFRPRRSCRNGKKLAASLNAFFSFLRFGVAMRRGRGEGKVKLTGKEKTLCGAVSPGDGCGAVCSLRYCWCCWWRSCSSTAPPAATTTASSRPCTAAFRPSPVSSKCTPAKRARRPPPAAAWLCVGWWSSSPIRTNMNLCCWTATAALSPRPAAPMPRASSPAPTLSRRRTPWTGRASPSTAPRAERWSWRPAVSYPMQPKMWLPCVSSPV